MSFLSLASMAAETAADAAHGGESGGLPQFDPTWWPSQLFWLAVTFGFLYWLMSAKFLPAIGGAIEERRNRIADDRDQAATFHKDAEAAEAAYNQALADAKAKAQAIAGKTREETEETVARMQAETDTTVANQIAAAEERINAMKNDAAAKVREAAAETTKTIVEALIDETPTADAIEDALRSARA
ncbi:MAG: ATP F0F1 synthase subunit B [Pseudomonadota bacterium]